MSEQQTGPSSHDVEAATDSNLLIRIPEGSVRRAWFNSFFYASIGAASYDTASPFGRIRGGWAALSTNERPKSAQAGNEARPSNQVSPRRRMEPLESLLGGNLLRRFRLNHFEMQTPEPTIGNRHRCNSTFLAVTQQPGFHCFPTRRVAT